MLRWAWSLPGLQRPVEYGAPACGEVVGGFCEVVVESPRWRSSERLDGRGDQLGGF